MTAEKAVKTFSTEIIKCQCQAIFGPFMEMLKEFREGSKLIER